MFGFFLVFEGLFEGWLLGILGYTKYFSKGFTYIFGLAWLIQTIVYFLFTYLIKVVNTYITQLSILIYAASFIAGLFIFQQDIFIIIRFVLIHGLVFLVMNGCLSQLKRRH